GHREVLLLQIALQLGEGTPQKIGRPSVLAERVMGLTETAHGDDAHSEVSEVGGDRQISLGDPDRPSVFAAPPERCRALVAADAGSGAEYRVQAGTGGRSLALLGEVGQRLPPHLAAEGMMGEACRMLGQPLGIEPLQDFDDSRMKPATALLEKAAVRDLQG